MSAGSGRVEVTTAGLTFNGADLNNDDSNEAYVRLQIALKSVILARET